MSHLIEEYAKNLGVKIGKPVFEPHYFPIIEDKYITIHVDNKIDSKYYEFFPETLDLLKNIISPLGYKIYQIGGGEDPELSGVDKSYLGFSRKQTAYIIKNSSLHIGIDSFPVHLASVYDVPIISLYSHIYPQHAYPYWSTKEKVRILEADRKGNKPSYNYQEKPKSINTIKPEDIVKNACELLNVPFTNLISTKYIGESYSTPFIEIVPDFYGEAQELKSRLLNIRMDYEFNEQVLLQWASNYKVHIVTDQPIDLKILASTRNNIDKFSFEVNDCEKFPVEYLEAVKNLGIKLSGFCKNPEQLNSIRDYYFDFLIEKEDDKINLQQVEELRKFKKLKFLTKKDIFSKGKRFASKAHLDSNNPMLDKASEVIDSNEFWCDLEHYYIYEPAEL